MMNDNKIMLEAALKYAQRGWAVFPLWGVNEDRSCSCGLTTCQDIGKHPRVQRGVKEATRDASQIANWFSADAPLSNLAVATGEISGITVLDIDIGPGKQGDSTWRDLNAEAGEPQTLMCTTGSGGIHAFFSYSSALNTSSNTLGPGVDCRNDGGYVVAAPSRHRSGGRYAWEDAERELLPIPKHLNKKKETRGRPRADDPTRKKYTIEQAAEMLAVIPADDRELWRNVGIILGREYARADKAWEAYCEWSDKWQGQKSPKHDIHMRECFYEISQQGGDLTIGTIIKKAIEHGWAPKIGQINPEQFLYYAPGNNFIYRSTNTFWPAESVDAVSAMVNDNGALLKASVWLKMKRAITSMTSDPSIVEQVSPSFNCTEGVLIEAEGAALYNSYRAPRVKLGDSKLARPFLDHVRLVFNKPGDADQFLDYMAHRVQKPGQKPRFALLIAGEQGVGKDTAIAMCTPSIGAWNIANIDPSAFEGSFNEHAAKVLVVISEAANTNEMNKWAFNEATKVLIAGQPDYATINPKYGQKYSVRLHNGTIVTTNHMTTGIYIPPGDRRYDVIDSATKLEMGLADAETRALYFEELWRWFNEESGDEHIAALLHERDISKFSPSSGQRITIAHKLVVSAGFSGDDWLTDALDTFEDARLVRMDLLWKAVEATCGGEMSRKEFNSKVIHGMDRAGYVRLTNTAMTDGRWDFKDSRGMRVKSTVYYLKDRVSQSDIKGLWHLVDGKDVF